MDLNSQNEEKYLYIHKTPTWKVRILYFFGIISWLFVIYSYAGLIGIDPFFTWYFLPILTVLSLYYLISWSINAFYKQFNLYNHQRLIKTYWAYHREPLVDIFLPICGEDIEVLRNTWWHVFNISYKNKKIYVLDDSSEECEEHQQLANLFGFNYFSRPNKGENKKAGNLKYAYERTNGEFIAIFDADFAPHKDFLIEALPYTNNYNVGIVQTPQYFETNEKLYKSSSLAYAAAYQEEFFYRIIQVARNRFDAPICCGSNSIFRRRALMTIGGFRQVTASEDSRTGFALLCKGWIIRYIPVILATGMCPTNVYAYYHQQHRWCRGRSELTLSREFIFAPISFIKKLCYTSGFLMFLIRPLKLFISFHLFWILFIYNDTISLSNSFIFYLYLLFVFILDPLFHIAKFKKENFLVAMIKIYSSTHAIISVLMRKTVSWIPTNAKHKKVSHAFIQTTNLVGLYLFLYVTLILLAIRTGDLHLLNYDYFSIQFWIFWNILLTIVLFVQFLNVIKSMKYSKNDNSFSNQYKRINLLPKLDLDIASY
ncbi:MAG: glycosyl transferase family 2 protein, cellulose synthase (UDP-forming) [Candidatus Gottesmanbacteria bacterium GW2011_GWA2_43_14]|uniref:Glycosyl transferase family 2 protein, cellulose synthase (UDP-forming) n=1 Tax=Candidatus Gottesmanbacteria bacterium GW2011_GWA2_43_14 TaxID=1618443 RepID=A0A0G1FUM6_9BACT|nr:MAG: glycosyl transferase family 2 protein, cellulose synthase (UDP-forming) [Candidatus Gottesmanbacteria bacterium GW2011_GWA2_43_14]